MCNKVWAPEGRKGQSQEAQRGSSKKLGPLHSQFFNFHPTLTSNNSGLKPSKLKNYHIFGMPRTSAFSWYTPFRSYIWNSPLNQPSKLKKIPPPQIPPYGRNGSNKFVQILGPKSQISADTFLDHLTLEGAGAPNFQSTNIFTCSLKTLGHKLSDELLGRPLASILSERRAVTLLRGGRYRKLQKNEFFASFASLRKFCEFFLPG